MSEKIGAVISSRSLVLPESPGSFIVPLSADYKEKNYYSESTLLHH
jgi:hypothetical protein